MGDKEATRKTDWREQDEDAAVGIRGDDRELFIYLLKHIYTG